MVSINICISADLYLATEYRVVNLEGWPTRERVEPLFSMAYPAFREDQIAAAERQKTQLRSNQS